MICTYSGRYVNPFNPDPETIDPVDIAHALARIPRFNGHTAGGLYSVAQHSLTVAAVSRDRWGLFHDAAEAYMGDLARPLRSQLGWYRLGKDPTFPAWHQVEEGLLRAIAGRFGLPIADDYPTPYPDAVAKADDAVLVAEIRDLFPAGFDGLRPDCEPVPGLIVPWDDVRATEAALLHAMAITCPTAELPDLELVR